jgi:hypothetical protein
MLAFASTGVAAGPFHVLVRHLPEDANTLVLFNVEEILASPMGTKEGWRADFGKVYRSGLTVVPPGVTQFVLASQWDVELMEPNWTATVMRSENEPSMMDVSLRMGGHVDEVDGQEAAVLPNDTYVVKFGKNIVGSMSPADRQKATRWVQHAFSSTTRQPLGTYLTEAESYADKNLTPIIIAIDLEHVLSAKTVRSRLNDAEFLKGKNVDLDQLAEVLASVRGVTLGLSITDHVSGAVKVDFDKDVSMTEAYAKPLLLAALSNHGVMINEFNDWKIQVAGKQILLRGSLQQSGIQRVCSLMDTPADLRNVESSPGNTSPGNLSSSDGSLVGRTTLQYFKMLEQYVGDIKTTKEHTQTQTPGMVGKWYKRYAEKIDALPILNVDPEMIQFGSQLSATLRQAEGSMQGAALQEASGITNMQGNQVEDYQYAAGARAGFGGYGGMVGEAGYAYRYSYNPWASMAADGQEIAQIQMNARMTGYGAANQTMEKAEVAMANMRKHMTEKYKMEF